MKKRLLALALALLLTGCGSAPSTQADASEPPEATEPVVQPNIVSTLAVCGDAMSHMPQTRDAYDSQAGAYDYKPMIRFAKPWIEQPTMRWLIWKPPLLAARITQVSRRLTHQTRSEMRSKTLVSIWSARQTITVLDRGYDGMVRTLDVLDNLGLAHVGTYRSAEERAAQNGVHVADVGGIKVAFLSYTYGTNGIPVSKSHLDTVNILHTDYMSDAQVLDTARIADDLAAAEALSPDLIAVIVHWGVEYSDHAE